MFLKEWYLMTRFFARQEGKGMMALLLVWIVGGVVALPLSLFLDVLAGLGWILYKVRLWRGIHSPLDI